MHWVIWTALAFASAAMWADYGVFASNPTPVAAKAVLQAWFAVLSAGVYLVTSCNDGPPDINS